jgi:RNA polymerase sigma factor (TIGR02999 family)
MQEAQSGEVTRLLRAWQGGDAEALARLTPLIYGELRRMARRHMGRQEQGRTLQTTALIHDAWLRLVRRSKQSWHNRSHFFAVCAIAMRQILVDHARARRSAKRDVRECGLTIEGVAEVSPERAAEVLALDAALTELKALHPRQGSVVECRYFGGLTVDETAEALRVSRETVLRDWKMARAWLHRALSAGEDG